MAVHPRTVAPSTFIRQVSVRGLFGLYSYDLPAQPLPNTEESRLLILYGDNGSGKTTLLKLAFNLLAKTPSRGHKTYLARVPFRLFRITLANGIRITASRKEPTAGSYRVRVHRGDALILNFLLRAGPNNTISLDKKTRVHLEQFLKILANLNLTLYFLTDERKTESTLYTSSIDPITQEMVVAEELEMSPEGIPVRRRARRRDMPATTVQALQVALVHVQSWLRHHALRATSQGEADTNTIYTDIIQRIARAGASPQSASHADSGELVAGLRALEERSKGFSDYDLLSPLDVAPLIESVRRTSGATRQILLNVLTPYVDGLKARLSALQEIQHLTKIFLDSINSFLLNKELIFTLRQGLRILARNGNELTAEMLSSGERQLLLLFCNTIIARDQPSVVLIDEPELSLNVKWQRKLLKSLLTCTLGSHVQFVVATHSLELLAQHRLQVLRLEDRSNTEPNNGV